MDADIHLLGSLDQQGNGKHQRKPITPGHSPNAFQSMGLILKDFYMVTGRYDFIFIAEAPDDAALAKAILSIASKGAFKLKHCGRSPKASTEAS